MEKKTTTDQLFLFLRLSEDRVERWALAYLQVCLHEWRPGLHQEVTDASLTAGGSFMKRRLTSETQAVAKDLSFSIWSSFSSQKTFSFIEHRTHVSFSMMSRWDVGTERNKTKNSSTNCKKVTTISTTGKDMKISHQHVLVTRKPRVSWTQRWAALTLLLLKT